MEIEIETGTADGIEKHEISTAYCGNRIDITGAADHRRNENHSGNIFRVKEHQDMTEYYHLQADDDISLVVDHESVRNTGQIYRRAKYKWIMKRYMTASMTVLLGCQ